MKNFTINDFKADIKAKYGIDLPDKTAHNWLNNAQLAPNSPAKPKIYDGSEYERIIDEHQDYLERNIEIAKSNLLDDIESLVHSTQLDQKIANDCEDVCDEEKEMADNQHTADQIEILANQIYNQKFIQIALEALLAIYGKRVNKTKLYNDCYLTANLMAITDLTKGVSEGMVEEAKESVKRLGISFERQDGKLKMVNKAKDIESNYLLRK